MMSSPALQLARTAWDDPALTFAAALGAGVIAQAIAHHLRLPGIVLFLAFGLLLGPDLLGVVRPDTLGPGLRTIVGLAVAVILFEGGLNLNIRGLQRQAKTIRRLVTVGGLITAFGAAVTARAVMHWDWRTAIIFGTLVIVTGPTVVGPIIRRIRVIPRLRTILEAEGVLIDPIGAIIAVVVLEVLLATTAESAALELLGIPARLLVGLLLGIAGGFVIGLVLQRERTVPPNVRNVFTLSLVLVFYAVSDAILPGSGILAAPIAGLVVGNLPGRLPEGLMGFKEELTIMLVGLLFVLLAADVRVGEVTSLGWPAILTIAILMLVVRPVNVALCTAGSDLSRKEKAFIAWIGPRGIVAAAVASLFAQELATAGIAGGGQLRALVFLTIAVTVLVQGLSGPPLASRLGLRQRLDVGYAIVGANPLARALARALSESEPEVVLIDSNVQETTAAKDAGFNVVFGNAHDERTLQRADVEGRRGFVAVTSNEGANALLANRARELTSRPQRFVAVARGKAGVQAAQLRNAGHQILFARPVELQQWIHAFRVGTAEARTWRFTGPAEDQATELIRGRDWAEVQLLPLVLVRKRGAAPVSDRTTIRIGDEVTFAILKDQAERVRERLAAAGWAERAAGAPAPAAPGPALAPAGDAPLADGSA
ncbi:MAG TPA: cation:proton antiporter [Gemmatimonadales bacterium]